MANVSRVHARLVRAAYKSLLRSAAKFDAAPAMSVSEHVSAFLPTRSSPATSTSWKAVVRAEFRKNAAVVAGPGLQPLVDGALRAMAMANQRVAALAAASASSSAVSVAAEPSRPSTVLYSVGQVFTHRQSGYRGVIIGWDERCKAGDKWVAATRSEALPHGTEQPFYHVLVDVRDRPDARVCYVAQDNIDLLINAPAAETKIAAAAKPAASAAASSASSASASASADLSRFIVIHPLLTRYFSTLKANTAAAATGKALAVGAYYEPVSHLSKAYAADTPAQVALPALIRQRAALLAAAKRSASATGVALRNVWLSKASAAAPAGGAVSKDGLAASEGSLSDSDDEGEDGEGVKRGSGRRAASGTLA